MQHTGKMWVFVLGCAVALASANDAAARPKVFTYRGMHPLAERHFCYLEVEHVHGFAPPEPRVFRQVGGAEVFIGDPVAFGYDGPKYTYYGPHVLVEAQLTAAEPGYCYLDGPHYHAYAPPSGTPFEVRGGVYWYMGSFGGAFEREKPRYAVVNEVRPVVVYERPMVDVAIAPQGFHLMVVTGASRPTPVRTVVIAPPPPPPTVQIGVGVAFGGPTHVIERERVIVRDRHPGRGPHRFRGPPPMRGEPVRRSAPPPAIRGVRVNGPSPGSSTGPGPAVRGVHVRAPAPGHHHGGR